MADNSQANIAKLLRLLRDTPIDNSGASETVLAQIYSYLIPTSQPRPHWFCKRADELTINAATFLLRLFAYSSPQVDIWKSQLQSLLDSCAECVQALERIKITSRQTYFAAFPSSVLVKFFESFEDWERRHLIEVLERGGFFDGEQQEDKDLSKISSILVYRIVSNWTTFSDPRIQLVIKNYAPTMALPDWPTDPLPPGMLLLLMHSNAKVRQWAEMHASKCSVVPIHDDQFLGTYLNSLGAIASSFSMLNNSTASIPNTFNITSVDGDFWNGFASVLRLLPTTRLTLSPTNQVDLRRLVAAHLHDTGSHFLDILRCLLFLIKRMGEQFWMGEGPEYPHTVLDSIRDNHSFSELVESFDFVSDRPWFLAWFPEYLHSVRNLSVYGDVLAKVIDFLCEELQQERFLVSRPFTIAVAVKLLISVLRKCKHEDSFQHRERVHAILESHADIFVSIAFSRRYNDEKWATARAAARTLASDMMLLDVKDLFNTLFRLCRWLADIQTKKTSEVNVPCISIRKMVWTQLYATLQPNDTEGVAVILSVIAQFAHVDTINKKAFEPLLQLPTPTNSYSTGENVVEDINDALRIMWGGFLDAISNISNPHTILKRADALKDVTIIMFSPVTSLQSAAKTLISLAFDVDSRLECFRTLLYHQSAATMAGLFEFLEVFNKYSPVVPEACSLSKSLVRCFTDIIEVLCSNHGGLLHDSSFLKLEASTGPAHELYKLWNLMNSAIKVIFKRTPAWSLYFENEEMIVWMRDALIFGRDLLAQWRTIEQATDVSRNSFNRKPGAGLSSIGKKMVNDLEDFLPELSRWLRLTDEELLHQSFALLQSLLECFRDTGIRPSKESTTRLHKHIETARLTDEHNQQARTRLDVGRLTQLEAALAWLDDGFVKEESPEVGEIRPPKPKQTIPSKPIIKSSTSSKVKAQIEATRNHSAKSNSISKFFSRKDQDKLDDIIAPKPFKRLGTELSGPSKVPRAAKTIKPIIKEEPKEVHESSDSDDSDAPGGGLAALVKMERSPKIRKPAERRQVKTIEVPSVQRRLNERIDRREESRKMALRLKPDISGLHRVILGWNYDHDGAEPPQDHLKYFRVPDKFQNYQDYRMIFEPLLLMECWSQIIQAKGEPQDSYECKITGRRYSDDWTELDITIDESVKKDWYLVETDIVLLRHLDGKATIMAKISHYRATPTGIQASLRCFTRTRNDPGLNLQTCWKLSKLFSLSTLHREYGALLALQYYDLVSTILDARLSLSSKVDPREISQTMETYGVNEPQAAAILGALSTEGFALIQGPPGTGKTSTICRLVALYLARRPKAPVPLQVGQTMGPAQKMAVPKILLCAPSNAAIDEIASRLKEGYRTSVGGTNNINVVRIGADKAMNISVRDISLDYLVGQKMNPGQRREEEASAELQAVRREVEMNRQQKAQKLKELEDSRDNVQLQGIEDEIKKLNARRMILTQKLDRLKDQQQSESRTLDAERRRIRMEILCDADVICSTLSGAGHEILEPFEFEMVIIDEAAQAIELSSLIPLKYRCARCIMVGDPQQLPPTVLSQEACRFDYNRSLFVRLQRQRPDAVHLLSIQYRMHPEISRLPSNLFYDGRLQDGPDMDVKTIQPWHNHSKFGTYRFYNLCKGLEEQVGRSVKNITECETAVALYAQLKKEFPTFDFDFRVGVVSMYRAQIVELKRHFEKRFGRDIIGKVDFNTVDGFQGQEKDVIILSCVRAGPGLQSVGFLSDTRRMNVALTRAKSSLFVLGNAATLERGNSTWKQIVVDARTRGFLIEANPIFFTTAGGEDQPTVKKIQKRTLPAVPPLPTTVPLDLVMPKDIKSPQSCLPPQKPAVASPQPIESPAMNDSAPSVPEGVVSDVHSAAKRPHEGEQVEPPKKQPKVGDVPRPRHPLPKRPKQASLFIPKNKQRHP